MSQHKRWHQATSTIALCPELGTHSKEQEVAFNGDEVDDDDIWPLDWSIFWL